MQLPVDIKALIDESTNIKTAKETEISLSVYLDETAPAHLIAYIRNAFASSRATVRMTISYLNSNFIPQPIDDFAVIVAGDSPQIGEYAKLLREVGVPTMLVAQNAAIVQKRARENNSPLLDDDLIGVEVACSDLSPANNFWDNALANRDTKDEASAGDIFEPTISAGGDSVSEVFVGKSFSGDTCAQNDSAHEALADCASVSLSDEQVERLNTRMGRWIVSVCREKRLAYAIAFPFVRRPLARDAVQLTASQNAGVGALPFLHGADLPIMTLNQAKMVMQIAAAYGVEMDKSHWKEIAAIVANAYVSRGLARRLVAAVPVLGFALRGGVAYGSTALIGYGVIEYFEGGQNVTGLAQMLERAAKGSVKIADKAQQAAGKAQKFAASLKVPAQNDASKN